jgi:hypothetical protein
MPGKSKEVFFTFYCLIVRYADNGAYSHSDIVRKSDGVTVIEDCWQEGAKNTEQLLQPDSTQ